MTLTVCPLSNLKLCVVMDLKEHPMKRMLDLGLQRHVQLRRPRLFRRLHRRQFHPHRRGREISRATTILQLARELLHRFVPRQGLD